MLDCKSERRFDFRGLHISKSNNADLVSGLNLPFTYYHDFEVTSKAWPPHWTTSSYWAGPLLQICTAHWDRGCHRILKTPSPLRIKMTALNTRASKDCEWRGCNGAREPWPCMAWPHALSPTPDLFLLVFMRQK